MNIHDIKKMKKDELLEYALGVRDELIDVKRDNKEHQDKISKIRKELNKSKENILLVNFAIDTQIRSEFPEMELLQIPPEHRPEGMEIPPPDKWYGFLVCLRGKLLDMYADKVRGSFY